MATFNLIAANTLPGWVNATFPIIRRVFVARLILLSIVLIVSVLMQPANQEGLGAISGGSDTFFSKNKGRTREGMLKRLTTICAVTMLAIAILYFISLRIDGSTLATKPEETAEAIVKALRR
ncbi:MAG: preprotein translocase subunit SecG [Clostridiales bacterium]|nr:preprotein translocase subunit SecG [Clostridiales bacterium]